MFSGRVKQSRPTSLVGFLGGVLFVGLGIFVIIPTFGTFGVVWTLFSAVIAAYHGYGVFSRRGVSVLELEGGSNRSVADRLAELEDARRRGLITEAEFDAQRTKIISEV